MSDRIHISIDREACMGSGTCMVYAANTFDIDNEGTAIVVDPCGDPDDAIRAAASGCPTRAITIGDTAAGATVPDVS